MTKPDLKAVGDGDRAPRQFESILDAAENGTRVDELIQMRRRIAKSLDDDRTLARDLASLSRRQLEISREIESIRAQDAEEAEESDIGEDEEWDAEAI